MTFSPVKIFMGLLLLCLSAGVAAFGAEADTKTPAAGQAALLQRVIEGVENRYAVPGFSADFTQSSTIKALDLTDTASGRALFMHPAKMRWEYDQPEKKIYISDGTTLWVYSPDQNQVMVGHAPEFFKGGQGASFLADMQSMRKQFVIALAPEQTEGAHTLKLLPREKNIDLASIYLTVDAETFIVSRVDTVNAYEDRTRIVLSGVRFEQHPDPDQFHFTVPPGADVLELNE
ncbi:MAG: outer membrane lipoprotein carrier protein LolA [Desulfobacterales bacterium]